MYLSIIIPTYNESDRILNTLRSLIDYLSSLDNDWEVIVSDDGSSDNTCEQVIRLINQTNKDPNVYVSLIQSSHKGKGSAIKTGMLKAIGDYRIMFDADLAMPPKYIDDFISNIDKGYDVVIGSREIYGSKRFDEPYFRHIMGRVFNFYIRFFIVHGYQDTQCGYKCFTAKSATQLFSKQVINGWSFDVEILYLARKYGFSVLELPINWYHGKHSKVKPLQASFEMARDTFLLKMRYLFGGY